MHAPKPLIALLLALAACDAHAGDVATVADQALTREELLAYLARTGPTSAPTFAVADAIAEGWLDLALVAEAAGAGLTPGDTALQREVLAPLVRIEHLRRLQNALAGTRPPMQDEELKRQFEGDSLRLFQRVFVRVSDWRDLPLVDAKRARADSILRLAHQGAPFDRLATDLSEGPIAPTGGYLGVVTRSQVPQSFRDSLWVLEPGGVSPVLKIDEGFQILRRPPFEEVRARFALELLRVAGVRADSLLADSLSTAHRMTILPSTADRLRAVLTNPDSLAADSAWVVAFDDGGVSPADAWAWLATLPDAARLSLARNSDVALEEAARALARNELLYRMAKSTGIEVRDDELSDLRKDFAAKAGPVFARFASAGAQARQQMVDSIVGSVLSGKPTDLLPAGLAPALRRRLPHAVDRAALADVARRASDEARLDSVANRS